MTQIESDPFLRADGSVGYCASEYNSVANKYVPKDKIRIQ